MRRFIVASAFALLALASAYDFTLEDRYTFEEYITDFKKDYGNDLRELERRRAIFEKRLVEVQIHNTHSKSTYRKGINHLSDRSDAEIRAMLGFKKPSAKAFQKKVLAGLQQEDGQNALVSQQRLLTELPDEIDWRDVDGVTAPKNQGSCGSCWTFSGTEAIESALKVSTGKLFTLSEQVYVSCTENPDHCGGQGGCTGGTQDLLFEYVMKNGFFAEEDYPYVSGDNGTEPLCYLDKKEAIGGIKGYVDVAGNDEAAHLIALNSQPLAISLDASTFHNYHSGVLQFEDCGSDLNHAVLLVGYGTDEETGIPFWLVRNSWGPQYGEDGYIRLARSSDCAIDKTPADGVGCEGELTPVIVCGTCGMLAYTSYPIGAYLY